MRILILGGDGYLGWPAAMHFAAGGHQVAVVDNYSRRRISAETNSQPLNPTPDLDERTEIFATGSDHNIDVSIGDCADYGFLVNVVRTFVPDAIIHLAEQPSAPYSMMNFEAARYTLINNLNTTFNVLWAVHEAAPECHLVKLGTMGEYGTPEIDIEEGWIDIHHKGRSDRFLFPRQAGSLYHTTKVLDTDLIWFYVRTWGLKCTDLMQGPVYGIFTEQSRRDRRLLPGFHYDDVLGTVLNRFIVQAVAGVPLTVYGKGGQVRGYLNLVDTLQCLELAVTNPPAQGDLRILNQFTETFTVMELAERVKRAAGGCGIAADIRPIANPRKEREEHYYNPQVSGFRALGLKPHPLTDEVLAEMLDYATSLRDNVDVECIHPRVGWN